MKFNLLTKEQCDLIVASTDAFYRADRVVEGVNVVLYDYRLASISDFVDHQAFELRGLCFVEQEDGTWKRNLLMNKFFNINQTTMNDVYHFTLEDGSVVSFDEDEFVDSRAGVCWGKIKCPCYVKENDTIVNHADAKYIDDTYRKDGNDEDIDDILNRYKVVTKIKLEKRGWMYDDVKDKRIVAVANKEDGSVITFVKFPNGNIRAKSKMSFDSEQAVMAQKIFDEDEDIKTFVKDAMDADMVCVFELCSPENQIVLEYAETELILLQVRDDEDGVYYDREDLECLVYNTPIRLARQHDLNEFQAEAEMFNDGKDDILDRLLLQKEINQSDIEGWVVTFADGQMAKIKTNKYLSLHGLIGPDAFRENLLIKTIIDDNIDDVISALVPGAKRDRIVELTEKVQHNFDHLLVEYKKLRGEFYNVYGEDRKNFSLQYSPKGKKPHDLFGWVMKSLKGSSFTEVEKLAQEVAKGYILKRCNTLGDAKDYVEGL
jgi:T4 RnlA family RNA ligase